jgi:hypothetical protein
MSIEELQNIGLFFHENDKGDEGDYWYFDGE